MQGKFDVRLESPHTPAELYELLLDARSWTRWGGIDELVLDQSHAIDPDGRDRTGAVRTFRTGRTVVSETITQLEPDRLMVYRGLKNPLLTDYEGRVELHPVAAGTRIRWAGRYRAPFPRALVVRPLVRLLIRRMARGLAAAPVP